MKVQISALLLAVLTSLTAHAQSFGQYFEDKTLRLDYILAGDNRTQEIFFEHAYSTTVWAGRKSRLSEEFLKGNGSITVLEKGTGKVLYTHSFSTLFQEWQATEEATKTRTTDGKPDITKCIDLAIVAEGYTAAQMDKFYSDCQRAVDAIFAHEPFTSMKNRFNVVAVASPSPDSGPSIPHEGKWRSTAVHTHYDTFYSNRYLMTQDMHQLFDLLTDVPFEHVVVLVNSSTYGGGGIYNQLTVSTSDHPTFKQVLVHEFGHAYGGLGDEYFYDDSYESMYPADTEPWEPNLTTLVDFESKWADMLPEGPAIPTPPRKIPDYRQIKNKKEQALLDAATQRIGVFEGGGYQSKGVYRPAQECRMKINEEENFCPVCARALVRITDFYTSH